VADRVFAAVVAMVDGSLGGGVIALVILIL